MPAAIDVDRGVSIRQIVKFDEVNKRKFEPDAKYGGLTVYMYKDEPGVYYDVHGNKVTEGIAFLAGFPVTKLAKARRKREAMAQFEADMSAALALEDENEIEVLAEEGDWQVVAMPMGRAKVVDKETGELVTHVPLPRADAIELLSLLVGTKEGIQEATGKKGKSNGSSAS